MEIGVRDLRNNLSSVLSQVRAGEEVVVTDRGEAIALLTPVGSEGKLRRLVAEGLATPAKRPNRSVGTPVRGRGSVSDLIADQRR